MDKSEIILSGPEKTVPDLRGSIAEYLIPKMKSQPKDSVVQIDYATNESITSYEFLRQCLEIAEGLIEFGLKRRDVVAITTANSIPTFITAIGVVMSGGTLAPLDATLKPFELQLLIKQIRPKYLVCEKAKAREIQKSVLTTNLDTKIILIDSSDSGEFFGWDDIKTKVADVEGYVPRKVEDPEKDIALISCSSGSTGLPKGIGLSHFSILFSLSLTEIDYIPEGNRALLFSSPLFWISGTILLLSSCFFGFTRHVPKSMGVDDVLEAIQKCKPFFILSTPAHFSFLTEHPNFHNFDLSSVKLLMSSGSVLGAKVASKIMGVWKGVKMINFYGLTETCGGVIASLGVEDMEAVGKLLPEAKAKIVDTVTGQSLGPNKIGEFRVKSKRLMRGYYNNEQETKAAFDENGWFRTGDLFFYNEEGVFYVVGRIKETIPYRNYEISPAEIESFIIGLAGVKDVAVVPVPHEVDLNRLRALVVKSPASKITAQDIINGVKENFTERKHLKAGVQFVEVLPRSEVGKLKRLEAQKLINIQTDQVYLDETDQ